MSRQVTPLLLDGAHDARHVVAAFSSTNYPTHSIVSRPVLSVNPTEWRIVSIIKAPVSVTFKTSENSGEYGVSSQCLFCISYLDFTGMQAECVTRFVQTKTVGFTGEGGDQCACQCNLYALLAAVHRR